MNERFKELAEQAGMGHERWNTTAQFESFLEKFAELIVEECTNAIINDNRLNDVRSAAKGCVRTINEHFGVDGVNE